MESKQYEPSQPTTSEAEAPPTAMKVNMDQAGTMIKIPAQNGTSEQVQEWLEPVSSFLSSLPDQVGSFVSDYQKPLITILLLLSGVVTVKVVLAVLDAINDIPLLSPVFELVGVIYSGWFIYRYFLNAATRQELSEDFNTLKGQVLGHKDS